MSDTAPRTESLFWSALAITNAGSPGLTPLTLTAVAGTNSSTINGSFLTPPLIQTFAYDADGNLTNDAVWIYSWDAENRLLSVQSTTNVAAADRRRVSWEYDPVGRRIRQLTDGWNGSSWTNAMDIRMIYDNYDFPTQILVASVRNPIHIHDAAKLGADVMTAPPAVIRQLFKHPLTDNGIKAFLADWEKTGQSIG